MKIIALKFQFSAVLATCICMPYIMSILMAIATTVITEGTVDVGFPAVLGAGVWVLGCRH